MERTSIWCSSTRNEVGRSFAIEPAKSLQLVSPAGFPTVVDAERTPRENRWEIRFFLNRRQHVCVPADSLEPKWLS